MSGRWLDASSRRVEMLEERRRNGAEEGSWERWNWDPDRPQRRKNPGHDKRETGGGAEENVRERGRENAYARGREHRHRSRGAHQARKLVQPMEAREQKTGRVEKEGAGG